MEVLNYQKGRRNSLAVIFYIPIEFSFFQIITQKEIEAKS